jgi:hypothetical protein
MAEEQWWTNGVERQGANMQDIKGSYSRQTTQEWFAMNELKKTIGWLP